MFYLCVCCVGVKGFILVVAQFRIAQHGVSSSTNLVCVFSRDLCDKVRVEVSSLCVSLVGAKGFFGAVSNFRGRQTFYRMSNHFGVCFYS